MTTPTITSKIPAVTDYLVQTAKAWPSLEGVSVFDGPQPSLNTQSLPLALWIGANAAQPGSATATAQQAWPLIDEGRTRDEDGDITCSAQHWSGDPSNKVHRDGVAAIVGAVELLLRGIPAAGGPGDLTMGGLVMWSSVDGPFEWTPRQVAGGTACLVTFTVSFRARLTTS
jgi:hypothetical protein